METNEEKKKVDEETTTSTDDSRDKPTTTPLIDIANASAKRMEEANKETERLLAKQEELLIKQKLGGMSEAGHIPPEQSDEERKKLGASEFFKDTALGEAIKNG